MKTYTKALKELRQTHKERLVFLSKHKTLFPVAHEYANKFTKNHSYSLEKRSSRVSFASDVGTIQGIGLYLDLGKNDVFNDVLPLITEMIRDPRLEMTQPLDHTIKDKYEPVDCIFKERGADNGANIRVRVFVDHSLKCHEVGTGEFKEIMKVVCD